MDQRSICFFLDKQGFSTLNIHVHFTAVLGSDTIAYSTITKYVKGTLYTVDMEVIPKMENSDAID
jgi:hypothetical protein